MFYNYYNFRKQDIIIVLFLFLGILILPYIFSTLYEKYIFNDENLLNIFISKDEKVDYCIYLKEKRLVISKKFISNEYQDEIVEKVIDNKIACISLHTDPISEHELINKFKNRNRLVHTIR